MVWFRENWYEEVLRQLKQGLAKCHAVAFENRGAGMSVLSICTNIVRTFYCLFWGYCAESIENVLLFKGA
jgi:hypothetical protein